MAPWVNWPELFSSKLFSCFAEESKRGKFRNSSGERHGCYKSIFRDFFFPAKPHYLLLIQVRCSMLGGETSFARVI